MAGSRASCLLGRRPQKTPAGEEWSGTWTDGQQRQHVTSSQSPLWAPRASSCWGILGNSQFPTCGVLAPVTGWGGGGKGRASPPSTSGPWAEQAETPLLGLNARPTHEGQRVPTVPDGGSRERRRQLREGENGENEPAREACRWQIRTVRPGISGHLKGAQSPGTPPPPPLVNYIVFTLLLQQLSQRSVSGATASICSHGSSPLRPPRPAKRPCG